MITLNFQTCRIQLIHDGPPVGAIGRSGIHIDAVELGGDYQGGDCVEQSQRFSVAANEHAEARARQLYLVTTKTGSPFLSRPTSWASTAPMTWIFRGTKQAS